MNIKLTKNELNMAIGFANSAVSVIQTLWYAPYLRVHLGDEAYGYITVVNGLINAMTVVTLALTSMSTRYITISLQKNEKEEAKTYYSSIFGGLLIASIFVTIIGIGYARYVQNVMNVSLDYVDQVKVLIILSTLNFVIQLITTPFLSSIYYYNDIYINYLLFILDYFARIIFTILLFSEGVVTIWTATFGTLIIYSLSIIVYSIYTKKKLPYLRISKKYFSLKKVKEVITSGVWVSITKAGSLLLSTLNSYFSNILCGALITGIYSYILQLGMMASMGLNIIVNCFISEMYRIFANDTEESLVNFTRNCIVFCSVFSGIVTGGFISLGNDFMSLWIDNSYKQYFILTILTVIYLPFTLPAEVINQIAITKNKIKRPAVDTLLFGVANVFLMLLLSGVMHMGIFGIAIANIVILSIRGIIYFPLYGSKILQVSYSDLTICYLPGVVITAILSFLGLFMRRIIVPLHWINFIMDVVLLLVVGVAIALIFPATRHSIRRVLKSERH